MRDWWRNPPTLVSLVFAINSPIISFKDGRTRFVNCPSFSIETKNKNRIAHVIFLSYVYKIKSCWTQISCHQNENNAHLEGVSLLLNAKRLVSTRRWCEIFIQHTKPKLSLVFVSKIILEPQLIQWVGIVKKSSRPDAISGFNLDI